MVPMQAVFEQVLEDTDDISNIQGSSQSLVNAATKRCNDLKAKLKAANERESEAEEARLAAEGRVSNAEGDLEALESKLASLDALATTETDRQLAIQQQANDLVHSTRNLIEEMASRTDAKSRDPLGKVPTIPRGAAAGDGPKVADAGQRWRLRPTAVADRPRDALQGKQVHER